MAVRGPFPSRGLLKTEHTLDVHIRLADSVFAASCSNWYHDKLGRNVANWPRHAQRTGGSHYFPKGIKFITIAGSKWGCLNTITRLAGQISKTSLACRASPRGDIMTADPSSLSLLGTISSIRQMLAVMGIVSVALRQDSLL